MMLMPTASGGLLKLIPMIVQADALIYHGQSIWVPNWHPETIKNIVVKNF